MDAPIRWTDILCRECTADVLEFPWTWGRRWQRMRANDWSDCGTCSDTIDRLLATRGPFNVHLFPELSSWEKRDLNAAHEAGHAVVGLEFGYPMTVAELADDPTSAEFGGRVGWRFEKGFQFRNDQLEAMYLAGAMAGKRWLEEQGHALTDADRIDLSQSALDDMVVSAELTGFEVPVLGAVLAEQMVSDRVTWKQMSEVALNLRQFGRLSAAHTRSVIAAATPQPPGSPTTAAPVPASRTTAAATTSGGSAVGIDVIRQVMSSSNEKARFASGALREAWTQLDEIVTQLTNAGATESSQDGPQQAMAVYTQLRDQLDQFQNQVKEAIGQIEQYAGQL
ncbi:hypothetical protein SAMN05421805_10158 [Saccharopolyspora antimicrobica]|uniref:Uncharacterized protein n=1 Tax=Saccharopolyspora antimicrobica TaxID=455193 RepID=A0A1I4QBW5_9PSEU|nr:hypothetical protein [Saccharopolyspora antimicrobica]RKT84865.1 hypothetical protein ATL45_3196 [Saccharopolyspora antimicrobica]SFM37558.1 hypothetical protein SAMN05421805_10158 [Saccharopolyspora antimicrobica]